MARKFSGFTNGLTNQSPTDTLVGLDLSLSAANQNSYWTLNSLFSVITRNITDGALRFGGFAAPAVSASGAGSLYFDSTSNTFKISQNGGAYANLLSGTVTVPQGGTGLTTLTAYAVLAGGTTSTGNLQQVSGVGTSGQVLTSNGAAALPTWQAAPAGNPAGVGTELQYRNGASFGAVSGSSVSSGAVTLTNTLQAPIRDKAGQVFNVVAYGADPTGVADSRAAIQSAIDAAAVAGGGVVYMPDGSYLLFESAGLGLVIKDKVRLLGSGSHSATITPNGTWTDSVIRMDGRDDNNPSAFIVTTLQDFGIVAITSSAVVFIDCVGARNSKFNQVYVNGSSTSAGQIGWYISDRNQAGTSHKSNFFNEYANLSGGNLGTWMKFGKFFGDEGVNVYSNHQAFVRVAYDITDGGMGGTFTVGYLAGDSDVNSYVFKGGDPSDSSVYINVTYEGFINIPSFNLDQVAAVSSTRSSYSYLRGVIIPAAFIMSFQDQAPILVDDLLGHFVVSGLSVTQNGATGVIVNSGVAYNQYRLDAASSSVGLSVTNTGSSHTEFVYINQNVRSDITDRAAIKLTSPTANDLVLANVSVDVSGNITAISDQRSFYGNPTFRDIKFVGSSAAPTTSQFTLTGTPTAARTLTAPDRTGTLSLTDVQQKAGDPTTSDIAASTWAVYKNTSSGVLSLWANDGGVMKSVALI